MCIDIHYTLFAIDIHQIWCRCIFDDARTVMNRNPRTNPPELSERVMDTQHMPVIKIIRGHIYIWTKKKGVYSTFIVCLVIAHDIKW